MNLIVTADDFGASAEVNAAVLAAHRFGILTSASLMVGGAAFDEAVEIARQNPLLAVGLHVVAVDGKPVLSPERLSHIVDRHGNFSNAATALGIRYFFDPRARRELADEIAAQFSRFAATGLPMSHIDGHQHMHVHPAIFPLVVSLGQRYSAVGIRLPRDELGIALRYDRRQAAAKLLRAAPLNILCRRWRGFLRGKPFSVARRVYGLFQSGRMEHAYVLQLLSRLACGSSEIYFHPSTGRQTDALGPNPLDLQTLLSPEVKKVIADRKIQLCRYADLPRE